MTSDGGIIVPRHQPEVRLPIWVAPLLLAPFIGSFLGVLIRRLPTGRPIVMGRSACEACGRVLAVRDLVPFVSYAMQRGRCRTCGAGIDGEHIAIEVAALAVAVCAVSTQSDGDRMWAACILGWFLLALGWIDWKHMRLPDVLTLPLLLVGLLATLVMRPDAVTDHAIAAALGYVSFRAISGGYRLLRHREGLGQGDAKLLAAAGAWVGINFLPSVVLGGALLALFMAAGRVFWEKRFRPDMPIAFGPSLALATWVAWLLAP
jgi:leader peptidase (prepilin peptidase)/N-methyltransferase